MGPCLRLAAAVLLAGGGAGCALPAVRSAAALTSAPRPPSTSPVRVVATAEVPEADELAIVEVTGRLPLATLEALMGEFRARVAAVGGDVGRLDGWATRYEVVVETYDFECGATQPVASTQMVWRTDAEGRTEWVSEPVVTERFVSRTCQGERPVEVATRTLVGRALRTRGGAP